MLMYRLDEIEVMKNFAASLHFVVRINVNRIQCWWDKTIQCF